MRSILFAAYLTGLGIGLVSGQTGTADAQDRDIRGCLSIADASERGDCLAGHYTPRQPQTQFAPSFDCRVARTSIERAICSDAELSEWDGRMGQAFQQVLRLRKDGQVLLETQRRWIVQRDRACGNTSEILFSCLLEMTKQRLALLSGEMAPATSAGQPLSLAAPQASPPRSPAVESQPIPAVPKPTLSASPNPQATSPAAIPRGALNQSGENPEELLKQSGTPSSQTPPQAYNSPTSSQGQGTNPVIILIGLGLALWLGVKVVRNVLRREELARRRQNLIVKYGEEVAERVLAGEVWQGMTDEQLVDSWGSPVEVGREIVRHKSKETWKYGQTGKNRFSNRVYLENGLVIGWKN